MTDVNALLILVAIPFIAAVIVVNVKTYARSAASWLATTAAILALAITILYYPQVSNGGVISKTIPWLPSLGLNLKFRMDGFTWMFAMLITGIGALVILYARYYMSPEDPVPRFFSFLLAFMGSMLGVVLSGNIIQLVIFWELTSIFSFLLIGYWYHNAAARDGARMALTITAAGGLCLLFGMLVIGSIVGSYDLDVVLASGDLIKNHSLYPVALILVLLGAFTKSAQFPFQFWLPNAMAAPTPVSAYLHSATMVKLGVFLLTLLWPVLSGTDLWFFIVTSAGLITLVLGAYAAIFQQDLKGLLAYSTISHLGLITCLLGMGSQMALVAAIFHIMNHATFKASLFMIAGIIDHETGTRDLRRLSGLFKLMPRTALLAIIASLAMAGIPLLNGFLSKEMFLTETLENHTGSFIDNAMPYIATLASVFSVVYSLRFVHVVFFGQKATDLPKVPHEPVAMMRFPVELLVLGCLLVGILPALTVGQYLHTAVVSVLGENTPYYSLKIWHGWNLPLLMSVIAIAGGVFVYISLRGFLALGHDGPPFVRHLRGQRIFERVMVTISWKWAKSLIDVFGTRKLQPQILWVILMALFGGLATIYAHRTGFVPISIEAIDPAFALLWAAGIACAVGAAVQAKFHRFVALALMSGSGLVTVLTFAWFNAPDLAVTQLLVEIVTTVLILLGLRWMPKRTIDIYATQKTPVKVKLRRTKDIIIAAAVGISMGLISYIIMMRDMTDTIGKFFLQLAYPEAGGHNVVNVILVDFRAFDTMGEIAVLGIVALTVFSLLRRFRPAAESASIPEQQRFQNNIDDFVDGRDVGDTVAEFMALPKVIMNWMFPFIIVLSMYFFIRGHDLPGGGFAAGITMSIGFLLQYMAGGARWVEARLRILPVRWIGIGIMISALVGCSSWIFGYPFMTTFFQYTEIPLIGKMPTASALIFDLGVFVLVVGATVLMLIAIAHQSLRITKTKKIMTVDETNQNVGEA